MNCIYRDLCRKSFQRYTECFRRRYSSDKEFRQPKFSKSPAYQGVRYPTPIHLHPELSKVRLYSGRFYAFQSFVIFGSMGCLVAYGVTREENDIDEMLDLERPLYKSVPVFEKEMLKEQIMLAKQRKDPPEVILEYEKRIAEIDNELRPRKEKMIAKNKL